LVQVCYGLAGIVAIAIVAARHRQPLESALE